MPMHLAAVEQGQHDLDADELTAITSTHIDTHYEQ